FLDVAPGARMLTFAALLSLASVMLFGWLPALRASAVSPEAALKSGGSHHSGRIGAPRWTLAAQIGFSVAVLFLSGLLLLSFRRLISVDPGFTSANVVLFDLAPRGGDRVDRQPSPVAKLLEHMRGLPAVRAASLSAQRPMGGDMVWIMTPVIHFAGRAEEIV